MLKSVKVRDYMAEGVITFSPETDLFQAIKVLQANPISGAPVVDADHLLVGMVSEVDCLKAIISGSYYDYESLGGTVSEIMSRKVDTVGPEDDILAVADRFIGDRRRRFPVVEEGRLVGQISRKDILRAVSDFVSPEQIHYAGVGGR